MILTILFLVSISQATDFQDYWAKHEMVEGLDTVLKSEYKSLPQNIDALFQFQSFSIEPVTVDVWSLFPIRDYTCGEVRTRYRRSEEYFADFYLVLEEVKSLSEQLLIENKLNNIKRLKEKIDENLQLVHRFKLRLKNIYGFDADWGNNNIMLLWKDFIAKEEFIESANLLEARLPTGIWMNHFVSLSPVQVSVDSSAIKVHFPVPYSISCFKTEPVVFIFNVNVRASDGSISKRKITLGSMVPILR